ncbi:3-oxo-5-alpha-steroid 4-dehydrogenase [Moesziomyces antarcticus]|uniref:3-oxo-5-alpha-steroid 4-dehydrogenase n=2 Tax=Pseudozyma antarctica TaxID=84753 RepID=A0A081CMF5_PSEA2|nr:3-oxo-5-alpha-steroid 4-dehydrogenase [Moesziomyces antarcticus]GAK67851.1 3-oxo-5-alpha-steroid 4-dehydrogenase [Moesziomyces antarcticus]SPO47130.1 probable steroid 5alpha-reductase [Moesziomyces antarcticus]
MALWTWLKDVIGVGALPSPPYSPAQLYSVVLASFKAWPFLIPVLSLINAPHGRFAFDSLLNINGNLGWFLMEIPSPIFVLLGALSQPLSGRVVKGTHGWLPPLSALFSPSIERFLALPSPNQVLVALFLVHYTHRAVLQPLRSPKRSPLHISVPLSAITFNLINGFVMGSWVGGRTPWAALPQPALVSAATAALGAKAGGIASKFAASEIVRRLIVADAPDALGLGAPGLISTDVWKQPLWYLGLAGWAIGFAGNVYHDEILMDIRRPNNNASKAQDSTSVGKGASARKYSIPRGGLFEYISFPNYLCEWFEWFAFAWAALYSLPIFAHLTAKDVVATALSTPPFLFPFVLVCLMAPRATNGHKWYKKTFGDKFPRTRKAIVPFVF